MSTVDWGIKPPQAKGKALATIKKQKTAFLRVRKAEKQYARKLRAVAQQVDNLVKGFDPTKALEMAELESLLKGYAEMIAPWARSVAAAMMSDVMSRDEKAWKELSNEISRNLKREISSAPLGTAIRKYMAEQVHLITSLPYEAAQRVHKLAIRQHTETGARAKTLAAEILKTGEVTRSRANTIARTEIARVSSGIVQARALHVGSTGYIWRTAGDSDVRKSHREMNGKFVKWDDMPVLSDGTRTHAGGIYNCRCWCEPILPDFIE